MTQCWRFLLIISLILLHGDYIYTVYLEVSAGHVFILDCDFFYDDEFVSVNWTRELNQNWDAELKVINQSLWFFPARESHSGNYSCYFSDTDGPSERHFSISVVKQECPKSTKSKPLYKNRYGYLTCDHKTMNKVSRLNSVAIVSWTWMKDCSPLNQQRNSEMIQFHRVSDSNDGIYTCVMNFTFNETSYTVAQSTQVRLINPDPVPQKPRIIKPRQETVAVKLGSKHVFNCKVFVGPGSCKTDRVEIISPYWLFNGMIIEPKADGILVEENCTTENKVEYRHSRMTIYKVQGEFFNIPFHCVVLSSLGHDNGTVVLIPSREKDIYVIMGVSIAFVLSALLFYWFRVDLVLACRRFSPCLKGQNDGKLYDAYVTYLQGEDHNVSLLATTFAQHVLPEVLENRFGYKLFISQRDATPGTAIPDVITETVGKSRRLIIILTPETFTNTSQNQVGLFRKLSSESLSLNNNISAAEHPNSTESCQPSWGTYECQVGLYSALVTECLQVILVQVGGDIDEALLSESLRYVKHTQGILKWKEHYKNKTSRTFWKQMLYRMPPVQKGIPGFML